MRLSTTSALLVGIVAISSGIGADAPSQPIDKAIAQAKKEKKLVAVLVYQFG